VPQQTKRVFVPTGEVRPPRLGEWFFCTYLGCSLGNTVHECVTRNLSEEFEIYEVVTINVDG
jgi:hypothetical protein